MRKFNLFNHSSGQEERQITTSCLSLYSDLPLTCPLPDSVSLVSRQSVLDTCGAERTCTASGARVAAKVAQGLRKSVRFAATILVLLFIGVGSAWGEDTELYFEGWETHHRNEGNNSYGTNTYGDWSLSYADAVNSGSPLTGSYHAILRVAKKTTNSPSLTSSALLNDSKYEIHKVSWNHKGVDAMKLVVSYSSNGTNWTVGKTINNMPTSKTADYFTISNFTGPIYLKFVISVTSSTDKNRDANIDDIKIEGLEAASCSSPATPLSISASAVTITTDGTSTLSTSGGNGGTVTYTVTSANASSATIEGNTFSATAAGTYTVQASQNENGGTCGGTASTNITVSLPTRTVTWKVNGSNWSSGVVAGNTSVTSGSKISAVPTSSYII